jgi:hypothetical protein
VLNKIAAHAGIKVCTTNGNDYKAIALANNNVTKNK